MPFLAPLVAAIVSLYIKFRIIKFLYSLFIIEVLFFAYKVVTEKIVNDIASKILSVSIDNTFAYVIYHSGFFDALLTYLGLLATYSSYKFLFRLLARLV